MLTLNTNPDYRAALHPDDAENLSVRSADSVEEHLSFRPDYAVTPLLELPGLAEQLGVGAIHVKDEGKRLGVGSFKALGGAFAVIVLTLEEAGRRLARTLEIRHVHSPDVRGVASDLTFCCATDGNHGRSVAQGAELVGARSAIFVHAGVSAERADSIARFGAEVIRVAGNYDDAVAEAASVAGERGWILTSDTSWPGYERIPGLVMQGYTAIVREALRQMEEPPTHVFIQAGVGGIAAAVAGHFVVLYGESRPMVVVVEPARAACLYGSALAGRRVKVAHGEPTVMAMLECYEPSLVAWRILSRHADAFMTVDDDDAITTMNRLARPIGLDPALVSGESGGAGLAGLVKATGDRGWRDQLRLGPDSRVFLVNTEGATDPGRFRELTGLRPEHILETA